MKQPIHIPLDYESYKELEEQLRNFEALSLERTHKSVEGRYHKSIRFSAGDLVFEFQGPLVQLPQSITNPEQG